MDIIWQIVGYMAMITIILSFQIKNQKALIVVQAAAQIMFVVHYIMIGSPSGAVQNFLSVVRALFLLSGNRRLRSNAAKYFIMSLFLLSPIAVYKNIADFLPGIAMAINTYYIWSMSGKKLRIAQAAAVSPLWIAYNIVNVSLPGVFTELFNISSSVIYLIRTRHTNKSDG